MNTLQVDIGRPIKGYSTAAEAIAAAKSRRVGIAHLPPHWRTFVPRGLTSVPAFQEHRHRRTEHRPGGTVSYVDVNCALGNWKGDCTDL
jgi:hypothetical protein